MAKARYSCSEKQLAEAIVGITKIDLVEMLCCFVKSLLLLKVFHKESLLVFCLLNIGFGVCVMRVKFL